MAVGQSVVLPCETEGKPTPRIYWKKGDIKLEERRYHLHWKGNLTIDVRLTIMTLSLRTDRSGQTVQAQIRLLQEEQSDQGLHCLLFHLRLFDKIPLRFDLFV